MYKKLINVNAPYANEQAHQFSHQAGLLSGFRNGGGASTHPSMICKAAMILKGGKQWLSRGKRLLPIPKENPNQDSISLHFTMACANIFT